MSEEHDNYLAQKNQMPQFVRVYFIKIKIIFDKSHKINLNFTFYTIVIVSAIEDMNE